jgi:hypothetical protein
MGPVESAAVAVWQSLVPRKRDANAGWGTNQFDDYGQVDVNLKVGACEEYQTMASLLLLRMCSAKRLKCEQPKVRGI